MRLLSIIFMLVALPSLARADDASPSDVTGPQPGQCAQLKGGGQRIQRCYTTPAGLATFTAHAAKGSTLWVEFDEPIVTFTALSSTYFSLQQPTPHVIVFRPRRDSWPATEAAQIRTKSMTITLLFEAVKPAQADAQLHVIRWDRRQRDAELERRLAARTKRLDKRYAAMTAQLDAKARELAAQRMVGQLARAGADIRSPRGSRHARTTNLVLHARKRYRVGVDRVLELELQYLKPTGGPFRITELRATLQRGDYIAPLESARWRCRTKTLRRNRSTRCFIALGLNRDLRADERLRITVREARSDRSVTLSGIDVR